MPLHIFEERYRVMFDELLENEGEFGIVWLTESGLKQIGCACEIARCSSAWRTGA